MIQTIKNAIKTRLDDLVASGDLGGASITDIKKGPFSDDVAGYPHAFVMPPAVESEVLDNRSNVRSYTFVVMILFQAEDLASTSQLEDTIEKVLNKFDNDPTLGGAAMAGMSPASSAPAPVTHGGRDLIVVEVAVQAREHVTLTFS